MSCHSQTRAQPSMRRRLKLCFLVAFAILPASISLAQTASTGAIRGNIVDSSGAAMSGVVIEAVSNSTGTQRKGTSEASGTYTMGLLPPGVYQLRFSAAGFETVSNTISVTETATASITMVVGAHQQTVEVSAAVDPLIQTEGAMEASQSAGWACPDPAGGQ